MDGETRSTVTRLLTDQSMDDEERAHRLLPLVYDELRELARARLTRERPGQTLQATALVHEAYLRLEGGGGEPIGWNGRGHFFAAAAEAMRRILIDSARCRLAAKRGGGMVREPLRDGVATEADESARLLAVHEALSRLERVDAAKARLVKLRYFAGLTEEQASEVMGMSRATAARHWAYARAWLYDDMRRAQDLR